MAHYRDDNTWLGFDFRTFAQGLQWGYVRICKDLSESIRNDQRELKNLNKNPVLSACRLYRDALDIFERIIASVMVI